MKTFSQIGTEIGALVERKNAAYGSSFARSGDFLRILYPDGLRPEQYDNALLQVRIFDKQMRIATDRDAFGESPYSDIVGYGILGVHMHQTAAKEEGKEPCVTARVDAGQPSTAQGDSAARPAAEPTIASASGSSAPSSTEPSSPPCSNTSASPDASAPDATAPASSEEAARGRSEQSLETWGVRNSRRCCAWGNHLLGTSCVLILVAGWEFRFCSETCKLNALLHLGVLCPYQVAI